MKNPLSIITRMYQRWMLNHSIRVMDDIDWRMHKAGWTRTERRRFWREFIKRHKFRTEVFNALTKEE